MRTALKPYEVARIFVEPTLPFIYTKVRRDLRALTKPGASILDVGGRRSPYTVGLPADITIFDLPRQTAVQHQLGLGIDDEVLARVRRRRSNISKILIGDMTRCELPDHSYDGVIGVEVIEHVVQDDAFMQHVARVIRPGGWGYFTTPNGDFIENTNPDHVRHYRREELVALLSRHFAEVQVDYGVAATENWKRGLPAFDAKKPLKLLRTMMGNLRNRAESAGLERSAAGTAHLFATVRVR